jgi:sulfur-carrier protein
LTSSLQTPARRVGASRTDVTVTVRYFAGAKGAAGTGSETVTLPRGTTVADLVAAVAADHGEALTRVLAASSLLLDGLAVHERGDELPDGAVVDVLPPFAGG